MPLITSFVLCAKKGQQRYLVPRVSHRHIHFEVSDVPPPGFTDPSNGFKRGMSGVFQCAFCGNVTTRDYVAQQATTRSLNITPTAVVAEGKGGRIFLAVDSACLSIDMPKPDASGLDILLAPNPRDVWCRNFGLTTPASLFTPRQLVALMTFSDLLTEVQQRVLADAHAASTNPDGDPLHGGGIGPTAYVSAVTTYLAFMLDRAIDRNCSLCTWDAGPRGTKSSTGGSARTASVRNVFARQAIPMTWDFAESNILSESGGGILSALDWIEPVIKRNELPIGYGMIHIADAAKSLAPHRPIVICTDPPYYDNIGYADLSDLFYVWLRRSLADTWPDLFRRLTTPKTEELVAMPYRHGGKDEPRPSSCEAWAKR
jgi:putative DNA methylase